MRGLILVLVSGALLQSPLADARDYGRPGFGPYLQAQGGPGKKASMPPQKGERDKRVERDKRPHGRLTEEQRRELHRDLDRANREIYRRR